jgi:hypothetical protein
LKHAWETNEKQVKLYSKVAIIMHIIHLYVVVPAAKALDVARNVDNYVPVINLVNDLMKLILYLWEKNYP